MQHPNRNQSFSSNSNNNNNNSTTNATNNITNTSTSTSTNNYNSNSNNNSGSNSNNYPNDVPREQQQQQQQQQQQPVEPTIFNHYDNSLVGAEQQQRQQEEEEEEEEQLSQLQQGNQAQQQQQQQHEAEATHSSYNTNSSNNQNTYQCTCNSLSGMDASGSRQSREGGNIVTYYSQHYSPSWFYSQDSRRRTSIAGELIQRFKRRTLHEMLQRPIFIQVVALLIWIHARILQIYYGTLARRLQ